MANEKEEFSAKELEDARKQLEAESGSSMLVSRADRMLTALGRSTAVGTDSVDSGVRGSTGTGASGSARGGK